MKIFKLNDALLAAELFYLMSGFPRNKGVVGVVDLADLRFFVQSDPNTSLFRQKEQFNADVSLLAKKIQETHGLNTKPIVFYFKPLLDHRSDRNIELITAPLTREEERQVVRPLGAALRTIETIHFTLNAQAATQADFEKLLDGKFFDANTYTCLKEVLKEKISRAAGFDQLAAMSWGQFLARVNAYTPYVLRMGQAPLLEEKPVAGLAAANPLPLPQAAENPERRPPSPRFHQAARVLALSPEKKPTSPEDSNRATFNGV